MEPKLNIAICGGGNLAHASIACIHHLNPHFKVSLLTRRPEVWQKQITAYTHLGIWKSKGTMIGKIDVCSNIASEVVSDADVIIICSPAHTKIGILKQIAPFVKEGALVGSIFGQGGFDLQAQSVFGNSIAQKKLTVFSSQYVPFICKAFNYGKECNIVGPKKFLYASAYPLDNVSYVCNVLSQCYHIPALPVPSFLNLTLCPSNQIIHSGRVMSFFSRFPEGGNKVLKFKDVPLLYEHLDQAGADAIQGLDDEIQAIKAAINIRCPQVNLDQVIPLKDRILTMYKGQVSDSSSLKSIFNTNKGYTIVPFPTLPVEGQDLKKTPPAEVLVKLNHKARFFGEDINYGLVILKDIAHLFGVATPNINKTIVFHQQYMDDNFVDPATGHFIPEGLAKTGAPSAYGITTIEQLVKSSTPQNIDVKNNFYFKQNAKM